MFCSVDNTSIDLLISCLCTEIDKNDGLVQDCSNSGANALEILQLCTIPSKHAPF